MSAPPPPPPHGENPKSSGLPPGKYDIFVIPEHSAGSGFLYLPSMKPNVNSFIAGFASALILVVLIQSMAPAFRAWWESFQGLGTMGLMLLVLGIAFGAFALGRTQNETPGSGPGPGTSGYGGHSGFEGSTPGTGPNTSAPPPPPPPHSTPPPNGAPPGGPPPGASPTPGKEKPKSSWQRPPQPGTSRAETPKGSWEKAREEMKKKEEERKAKEAEQKRRDDATRRLAELRAKEARERLEREKEREKREQDVKRQKDHEEAKKRAEDLTAKLEQEKKQREKLEKEAKELKEREEKKRKEEQEDGVRKGSSYAYSGVGEKTAMWPGGRPPVPSHTTAPSQAPTSASKRPPAPTAKTYVGTDEDAYSYRPYDSPKKPRRKKSLSSVAGSESSWAPSHTTTRTSPPPSNRGPYSTKDPDKIVIQAVYLFMNQFSKTPASQLMSGVGSVTDGLILRITTEGLFIDDDVRGVPQREWDVKAWTLKQVEVWCPPHCFNASASASSPAAKNSPNLLHKMAGARARGADRGGAAKMLTGEEADAHLTEMLYACKNCCRLGLCDRKFKDTDVPTSVGQTGEWKSKGLHVLRATLRDQESKRYLFVVDEAESWKLAVGLQRLRRGTQVRQLGVSSMTPSDAKATLDMLGWAG